MNQNRQREKKLIPNAIDFIVNLNVSRQGQTQNMEDL